MAIAYQQHKRTSLTHYRAVASGYRRLAMLFLVVAVVLQQSTTDIHFYYHIILLKPTSCVSFQHPIVQNPFLFLEKTTMFATV